MVPLERLFGARRKFPAAFPAGLRLHSLAFVKHHAHEYMVTPKLDGERRILLLGPAGAFSLDRRMRTDPLPERSGSDWTVLDCEMLEGCTRWVAFDALWLEGTDLRDVPFADRYAFLCEWRARTKALPSIYVKRAFPWSANDTLLAAFSDTGRFTVPWSEYMVGDAGEQKQKCESTVPVDGLVIMRRRATAAFDQKFDLLKWKPCPTIDVLVRSADLFAGNPSPLAHFWKYSEREQRCTVREFGRVGNALPAGTTVDTARFTVVEVAHDADEKRWEIHRVRLDKRRANAAPTIFETQLMVDERIGRDELTSAISVRPVLRTSPTGAAWLGDVWRRYPTAELEVRVLHRGSPDLPEDTFDDIVQRLHAYVRARELVHHREESTDYFSGSVRTTVRNGSTRSIVKERVARYDLRCEESELAARVALSYEHDAGSVVHGEDTDVVQYRRHKIRECFVHGGKLQVHCTRVRAHRADDDAWQEDPEVLQIELEAVRSDDWSLGSRDPVISLMWRFAGLVLGKDPRTCSFGRA